MKKFYFTKGVKMKGKILASIVAMSAILGTSSLACTTILVGDKASNDGSMLVARSADSKAIKAQVTNNAWQRIYVFFQYGRHALR